MSNRCTDLACPCVCHREERPEEIGRTGGEPVFDFPSPNKTIIGARTPEQKALSKLKLMYGMTQIRQDPNGTWWIGNKKRPDLLNMDTLEAAATYLDSLPETMIKNLSRPRGADSEPQGTDRNG